MIKELIMICVDNSEWILEGPNRFLFQAEAIYQLLMSKATDSFVGISTIAGEDIEPDSVLAIPSSYGVHYIETCIYGTDFNIGRPYINLKYAFRVAEMASRFHLTHLQTYGKLIIVLFAGGPVKDNKEDLEKIGMDLKYKNVVLHVINFGGQEDTVRTDKLEALVAAMNHKQGRNLWTGNGRGSITHVQSDGLSSLLGFPINIFPYSKPWNLKGQKTRKEKAELQLMNLRSKRNKIGSPRCLSSVDQFQSSINSQTMDSEVIMICVDNSEWILEDPNRFLFQDEAIYQFHRAKPQHIIGISTIAAEDFETLSSKFTTHYYNGYNSDHHDEICLGIYGPDFNIASHINLDYTLQFAPEHAYPLSHLTPSSNPLRIVLFVGGPINEENLLNNVGAHLKHNKIALDVFNFGEEEDKERMFKLDSLVAAANNNGNSRIMHVPSPSHDISSVLSYLNVPRDLTELERQKQIARKELAKVQLMKLREKRKKLLEYKTITAPMYAMRICPPPKENLECKCQICRKTGQEAYCCRSCFASNDSISRDDGNNQNRGGCARGGFSARNGGNPHDVSGRGRSRGRSERSTSSEYGSFSGSKSRSTYNHPDMPPHSRGHSERGAPKEGLRWVY